MVAIQNCALWSFLSSIWVCWLSINYFLIHVPIPYNGTLFPITKSVWLLFHSHFSLGRYLRFSGYIHVTRFILDYCSRFQEVSMRGYFPFSLVVHYYLLDYILVYYESLTKLNFQPCILPLIATGWSNHWLKSNFQLCLLPFLEENSRKHVDSWKNSPIFFEHIARGENWMGKCNIKRRSNIYCSQRKIGTMYIHSCSACKRWKPMLSVEIILGGYNLNPAIDSEFCGKATSPFVLVFISAALAFISLRIVMLISSVSFWSHNNLHVFYLTKIIILKYFIFNRWETNSHYLCFS